MISRFDETQRQALCIQSARIFLIFSLRMENFQNRTSRMSTPPYQNNRGDCRRSFWHFVQLRPAGRTMAARFEWIMYARRLLFSYSPVPFYSPFLFLSLLLLLYGPRRSTRIIKLRNSRASIVRSHLLCVAPKGRSVSALHGEICT